MVDTGIAIKNGKRLRQGGKVNIAPTVAGCNSCCCIECTHCTGCSVGNEPNCTNCGAPAGCCTPCELELVFSGVNAGRCTLCHCFNQAFGFAAFSVNSLAVDGTHCVPQISACRWQLLIVNGANITGHVVEFPFCTGNCETKNVDLLLEVVRQPLSWAVNVTAFGTIAGTLCNLAFPVTTDTVFNAIPAAAADNCKAAVGPAANTLGPCPVAPVCVINSTWSDSGTVTVKPCCA